VFLQSARASPRPRKKFEAATEVRRSSRAKTTVSYKEDVSYSFVRFVLVFLLSSLLPAIMLCFKEDVSLFKVVSFTIAIWCID
jgi:hypothetical protein